MTTVRAGVLASMESVDDGSFLVQLVWELGFYGRGCYYGRDNGCAVDGVKLRCILELSSMISGRLEDLWMGREVCSDKEFLALLETKAVEGDCVGELYGAAMQVREFIQFRISSSDEQVGA